jgi:hypothetical protein
MPYPEARNFIEQIKRHVADLNNMSTVVRLWQTADYHVGIADSLNLIENS